MPAMGDDISTDRGHGPLLRYALSYGNNGSWSFQNSIPKPEIGNAQKRETQLQ